MYNRPIMNVYSLKYAHGHYEFITKYPDYTIGDNLDMITYQYNHISSKLSVSLCAKYYITITNCAKFRYKNTTINYDTGIVTSTEIPITLDYTLFEKTVAELISSIEIAAEDTLIQLHKLFKRVIGQDLSQEELDYICNTGKATKSAKQ